MENDTPSRMPNVPPFVKFVCANVPMVFDDSLSYYEALCALWKYVQGMTDVINNNATLEEEFIEKFKVLSAKFYELKNYVDTYFDNLDVQEEINNKLDEMAESGQLQEIISEFLGLGALVCFDTEQEMIESENLVSGAKVQTLGKYAKNDGYGAYYTIAETGDIELDNGLYATLIEDFGGNNYIDEITLTTDRYDHTDFYVLTIPKYDNNGNIINPSVNYSATKSPLGYADENFTTLTINASCTVKTPTLTEFTMPIIIGDGVVLHDTAELINAGDVADNYTYLGLTADRTIKEFKMNNTTAQMMLDAGCIQVFNAYFKLIEHGARCDLSNVATPEGNSLAVDKHPRQVIATKSDGTMCVITNDGRDGNNGGTTGAEMQDYLIENDYYDAWELDGGGSTSTVYKGTKLNRNMDGNHTIERRIPYTLNFKSATIDKELAKLYSHVGETKQELNRQILSTVVQNHTTAISQEDLNDYGMTRAITFGQGASLDNAPESNGYFLNIPHSNPQYVGKNALQIFSSLNSQRLYKRSLNEEVWTDWKPLDNIINMVWYGSPQSLSSSTDTPLIFKDYVGDSSSKFITLVNETSEGSGLFTGVKLNRKGWYKFTLQVELTPTSDHYVYLKGYKNSGVTGSGQTTFSVTNGKRTAVSMEYMSECTALTDVYAMKIAGANGDSIHRAKLIIEQLNH